MKFFMGIDPGMTGGIAITDFDSMFVRAWRYPGDIESTSKLIGDLVRNMTIPLAAIERVHAMPGQGVSSMFKFGMNFGGWMGILAAYTQTIHLRWRQCLLLRARERPGY